MDAHDPRSHKAATAVTFAVVALAMIPPTSVLAADDESRGLSTGMGHTVRVRRRAVVGIEAGMPRDSAYAKALELDRVGKHDKAYRMFRQAYREFSALKRKRRFDTRIDEWIAKASQQQSLSNEINRYPRYRRLSRYRYHYLQHRYAVACHKKYLAIRAFGLKPPHSLVDKAVKVYKALLKQSRTSSRYNSMNYLVKITWLNLAALYVELGRFPAARLARRNITSIHNHDTSLAAAYYHAVVGQRTRALNYLRKGIRKSSWRRRQVRRSNFFDSLRGDPRFEQLVKK